MITSNGATTATLPWLRAGAPPAMPALAPKQKITPSGMPDRRPSKPSKGPTAAIVELVLDHPCKRTLPARSTVTSTEAKSP